MRFLAEAQRDDTKSNIFFAYCQVVFSSFSLKITGATQWLTEPAPEKEMTPWLLVFLIWIALLMSFASGFIIRGFLDETDEKYSAKYGVKAIFIGTWRTT